MSRLYLGICRYKHLFTKKRTLKKVVMNLRERKGVWLDDWRARGRNEKMERIYIIFIYIIKMEK